MIKQSIVYTINPVEPSYDGKQHTMHRQCAEGVYRDYRFHIADYGVYPCCYIEIDPNNPLVKPFVDSNDFYGFHDLINCHGGITWNGRFSDNRFGGAYCIGWDYGHCEDLCVYDDNKRHDGYRWPINELISDVTNAIDEIIEKINSKINK